MPGRRGIDHGPGGLPCARDRVSKKVDKTEREAQMDARSLIATCAALVLAACASTPAVPPPAAASPATAAPVAAPTTVATAPAQPSTTPVVVDQVDAPTHINGVKCKEGSPTGTRLPSIICVLSETERDRSPGTTHQIYIEPR